MLYYLTILPIIIYLSKLGYWARLGGSAVFACWAFCTGGLPGSRILTKCARGGGTRSVCRVGSCWVCSTRSSAPWGIRTSQTHRLGTSCWTLVSQCTRTTGSRFRVGKLASSTRCASVSGCSQNIRKGVDGTTRARCLGVSSSSTAPGSLGARLAGAFRRCPHGS